MRSSGSEQAVCVWVGVCWVADERETEGEGGAVCAPA